MFNWKILLEEDLLFRLGEGFLSAMKIAFAWADARPALIAEFSFPNNVSFVRRSQGFERPLAAWRVGDPLPRVVTGMLGQLRSNERFLLRVPCDLVFERLVSLPLAAEGNVRGAIYYQLERLVPFLPSDIHWGAAVHRRDPARKKVSILLTVVPNQPWAALRASIRENGIQLSGIETAGHAGIRLLNVHEGNEPKLKLSSTKAHSSTLAGLLMISILTVPFAMQYARKTSIEREISATAGAFAEAESLERDVTSLRKLHSIMVGEERAFGDPAQALATLTDALADDSYLTAERVNNRTIFMTGRSASPPSLVRRVSLKPEFHDAMLVGPTVANSTDGLRQFTIKVTQSQ